jgi:hypothetical protein
MKKLLIYIILVIFCTPAAICLGATYNKYIQEDCATPGTGDTTDCDGGGDDAYATFAALNTFAATLSASDVLNVYLNKGDTWNSDSALFDSVNLPNSTILVSAYGSGNDPVIDISTQQFIQLSDTSDVNLTVENYKTIGRNSSYSNPIMFAYSTGDLVIQDFEMDGTGGASGPSDPQQVIRIYDPGGSITVQRGIIHDMGPAVNPSDASGDTAGIVVYQADGSQTPVSLDINNMVIYNMDSDCIALTGVEFTGAGASKGDIYDNTFYAFGENAVDIKSTLNINYFRNHSYRNGWMATTSSDPGVHIVIHQNSDSGTWSEPDGYDIYNNYFAGNSDGTYDRRFFSLLDLTGGSLTFRDNLIKNCIRFFINDGAPVFYNNIWHYTRAIDHADGDFHTYQSSVSFGSGVDAGALFYHNAIHDDQSGGTLMAAIFTNTPNVTIKNNAIKMYRTNSYSIYDNATNDYAADNNRHWSSNDNVQLSHNGNEYVEGTNFMAGDSGGTDYAEVAGHTNEVAGATLFNNPANVDFSITASDAGEDLGASYDLGWDQTSNLPPTAITTVSRDATDHSRGAYAYQTPPADPSTGGFIEGGGSGFIEGGGSGSIEGN